MKTIGVIPARFASKRFEGKVLAQIKGKPMIQHVWERAAEAKLLDEILIACDDERVYKLAQSFGAQAVLTPPELISGTDRIAEAVADLDVDVIVNIQGDEPLIDPQVIDALADVLLKDELSVMATVVKVITDPADLNNPNVVKAVLDDEGNALYFSRSAIPFNRDKLPFAETKYYKHLGIYAYTKDFLMIYRDLPKSYLEEVEHLEQLRVLEAGYKIRTVETDYETIGVDTPEDLIRVEKYLENNS